MRGGIEQKFTRKSAGAGMYTLLGPQNKIKICEVNSMPSYLVQASYTIGALGELIANPQDRSSDKEGC